MKIHTQDWASLLLRLALGGMFLAHGLLKWLVFSLPGTAQFFASVGFPGWTAYLVTPAEIVLGGALLVGLFTRYAALLSLPILLGALNVHAGNGWLFSSPNGGWEYPLFLLIVALVLALQGGGQLALTGRQIRE